MTAFRFFCRAALLGLPLVAPGCEPSDIPGGQLTEMTLRLAGKNPAPDGTYLVWRSERAAVQVRGTYDNGRTEEIALGVFLALSPEGPAVLQCDRDDLGGARVVLVGEQPGRASLTASTREGEGGVIPCASEPDGGWVFRDAGPGWPLESEPLAFEVRAP